MIACESYVEKVDSEWGGGMVSDNLTWRERRRLRRRLKESVLTLEASRDVIVAEKVKLYEKTLGELRGALADRSKTGCEKAIEQLVKQEEKIFPRHRYARFQEFVDVILVAAIVAFGGIRTFWVMPFKIPTASMFPTLFGIEVEMRDSPLPWWPKRLWDAVIEGRQYLEVVAKRDGIFDPYSVKEINRRDVGISRGRLRLLETKSVWFEVGGVEYNLPITRYEFEKVSSQMRRRPVNAGDLIFRVAIDAGDHLLVERFTYNFRKPRRGEIVVFDTNDLDCPNPGQFYIKRLNGVGGDKLTVEPPFLKVNGQLANSRPAYQRIFSRKDGYGGFTYGPEGGHLAESEPSYNVPNHTNFMMGDNSGHSSDSRYWGPVPDEKVIGKALLIYWPFVRNVKLDSGPGHKWMGIAN